MNEFQIALLVWASIVALASWQLNRSLRWIMTGAASFLASAVWERYQLPMPALFTAWCDGAVCLSIYAVISKIENKGRAWEMMLYRLFQVSVLISIVYVGLAIVSPKVAPHYLYISLLEAVNWAALFLIFGTAAMQWIKADGGLAVFLGRRVVLRTRLALFAPKAPHRWWIA